MRGFDDTSISTGGTGLEPGLGLDWTSSGYCGSPFHRSHHGGLFVGDGYYGRIRRCSSSGASDGASEALSTLAILGLIVLFAGGDPKAEDREPAMLTDPGKQTEPADRTGLPSPNRVAGSVAEELGPNRGAKTYVTRPFPRP